MLFQGLQFAQFDDSGAQAGLSFAIPARDLTLTRYFVQTWVKNETNLFFMNVFCFAESSN